jgi:hypothetical protein
VIFQKVKFKIKRRNDFRGFQFPKVRKINKTHQISIYWFSKCNKKNIKGWLKFCNSQMVYSQIWLNLPEDDHYFGFFNLILQKNTPMCQLFINATNLSMNEGSLFCFVVMRSTELGCFRLCSWCLWKALNEEGCMGLVPWRLDLQCKSFWILNDSFIEN